MANVKITQLPTATTPLTGTEVFPLVQGTTTKQVAITGLFTSPVMSNPTLGVVGQADLINATGLPIASGVSGLGAGIATFLGTPSSANLRTAVTDETGTGALVFANAPVLVAPDLGTPTFLVATNATGTAVGLTAGSAITNANLTGAVTSVGNATSLGSFTSAQLRTALTDETGAGSAVFATSPTITAPILNQINDTNNAQILGLSPTTSAVDYLVVKNGIGTGVPLHFYADGSSANIGLHIQPKGTGLVTISDGTDFNKGIRFRSSGSAASAVTLLDAVSTAGRVVTLPDATTTLVGRDTTDTLTNKTINLTSNTLVATSAQILAAVTDETGTGSLVFATSPTLVTPALGTPSSGVVTNLTGTASININGTVGATTASSGAFTTLSATAPITGTAATTGSAIDTINLTVASAARVGWSSSGRYYSFIECDGTAGTGNNYMRFAPGNGEVMRITTGVGIAVTGTLSATGVSTFSAGTAALPALTTTGDTNTGIFFPAADTVATSVGGSEGMRLTSTGLGIGTSAPGYPLVVSRTTTGSSAQFVNTTSYGQIFITSGGTDQNGYLTINPSGTGTAIIQVGNSDKVTINSTGNVGIGTTSPQQRLHAYNNGAIAAIQVQNDAYSSFMYLDNATGTQIGTNSATLPIYFYVGAAERMRITSAGNVGIGTTSPSAKLHVSGTSSYIALTDTAGTANTWWLLGKDSTTTAFRIYDATASAERMRIDSAGNLGLGVTPSAWNSGIKAFELTAGALFSANDTTLVNNAYINSAANFIYKATLGASSYVQYNGKHTWNIAASGTAGTTATFTQAMTLDASGNLGLGVTSPAARLDTRTSTASTTAVTDVAYFYANSTGTATSTFGARIGLYTQNANGNSYPASIAAVNDAGGSALTNLAFYTYNSTLQERARIDSSGNFMVGTTASAVTSGGLYFAVNNGGTGVSQLNVGHITGAANGSGFAQFFYAGTGIGSITQNGTTGVLFNLTSDYRLKNNPQALTGAKDFVMALQPKKWQWWDGSGEGVGFIAHEFMEVAKYSGHGEKDAVDDEGKPIMQSIQPSSSEVMANLVSLIQEQQAIIESLKARLDAANL